MLTLEDLLEQERDLNARLGEVKMQAHDRLVLSEVNIEDFTEEWWHELVSRWRNDTKVLIETELRLPREVGVFLTEYCRLEDELFRTERALAKLEPENLFLARKAEEGAEAVRTLMKALGPAHTPELAEKLQAFEAEAVKHRSTKH